MPDTPHNSLPELPSKSKRVMRRYPWAPLALVAAVGLVLSVVGFWDAARSAEKTVLGALMSALYGSLLGFWFNAPGTGVPWTLQLGRLLTLIAAAAVGSGLVIEMFRTDIRRRRARRMSDHVVVCGLGELGRAAADSVLAAGTSKLTIVENVPSTDMEAFARRGAGIVIGDATDPLTLLEAGADRANHLLACCGSDDRNASVAEAARLVIEQVGRTQDGALSVRVHVDDTGLLRQLRPCILEIATPGVDIDFFSVAEIAASRIVDATIGGELTRGAEQFDAVVIGGAVLAEQLVLHLARTTPRHRPSGGRPVVALASQDAKAFKRFLLARHRHLAEHITLEAIEISATRGDTDLEGALLDGSSPRFRFAYVCTDDDGDTVRLALALTAAARRSPQGFHTVACIYGQSGIATLAARSGDRRLTVFDAADAVRDSKLITLDTIDHLARAVHGSYFRDELEKPASARTSKFKSWEDLDEETREDNRDHVRHFFDYLSEARLRLVPLVDQDEEPAAIEGDTLEILAQNEHRRWCDFKYKHGWRQGVRDNANRVHNCLTPWAGLDEEQRDKDRNPIRRMPRLLKDAGIALVRSDSADT